MITKEILLATYPGANALPDTTINWWIGFSLNYIDGRIPEAERDKAHALLASHNLCKIAENESLQEELDSIEINEKVKKTFSKRRYKSTIDNNYDTTPYGIAYKEMVKKYTNETVGSESKSFLLFD